MVHGTPSIVPGLQEVVLIKQGEGCQWVDASQSLHRCRGSKDESVVPTLLPGTNFWSVALQRSVLGKDALALQGLYHDCFDELFLGRKPCSLPVWFVVSSYYETIDHEINHEFEPGKNHTNNRYWIKLFPIHKSCTIYQCQWLNCRIHKVISSDQVNGVVRLIDRKAHKYEYEYII